MVMQLNRWLVAVVAMLGLTQMVHAQDAGEIVRHCVQAMQDTTDNATDRIGNVASNGVAAIRRLDANGASDRELTAAANQAFERIRTASNYGERRINLLAARCAQALRALGADRRYFQIVHEARDRSLAAIGHAARRGHAAVQAALDAALDD